MPLHSTHAPDLKDHLETIRHAAFRALCNTKELQKIILHGQMDELCPCPACSESDPSLEPTCSMTNLLRSIAKAAELVIAFKKVVIRRPDSLIDDTSVKDLREAGCLAFDHSDAHLVWVNFVVVTNGGWADPDCHQVRLCLGNLVSTTEALSHPEVLKYLRFFELCLHHFPERYQVKGVPPMLEHLVHVCPRLHTLSDTLCQQEQNPCECRDRIP
ncbi:hypothetical protein GUITHDRAFT_121417 [Guillardia theta CCMP2712]|uniref:Uncharacterized protein n=1 Tax=Guillardia theta (strain CCMP2712) TaxID=905079 RepID=L1I864_GUITC|nr:hypothetical protein GUITHDRAFT_121417 [Guillardia theta CCMP2712]EKX32413.1 hypothetical protein GUITHDRAFT_121417 [Guillardia theta CCMP2712]|eukprot:XP_005819393.1 hypothetical protein GUITHDRAFT_121417 [Guillardia theta CCMP2712]